MWLEIKELGSEVLQIGIATPINPMTPQKAVLQLALSVTLFRYRSRRTMPTIAIPGQKSMASKPKSGSPTITRRDIESTTHAKLTLRRGGTKPDSSAMRG
jgi:hypothetical protein